MSTVMLSALLLAAVAQSTPRPIEGLMNRDFESLYTCPSGPVCGPSPIDGAFWVGAEGKTLLSGTDRILRLKAATEAQVYQKVGCAAGHSSSISLSAQARVAAAGDDAWITLEEGGEASYPALAAVNQCNDSWGQWSFFLYQGTLVPIDPCPAASCASGCTEISGWARVTVGPTPLVFQWTAPKTGMARVVVRTPREDGSSVDVIHEILKGTTLASSTLLRSDTIVAGDQNGRIIELRTAVSVGEKLFFRASITGGSGPAIFEWHPTVSYEGRRLTYRFSTSTQQLVDTASQAWIHVPSPAGQWTSLSNVAAGVDFFNKFGSYPKAPLHIELAVPGTNANRCDFDDLSCSVDYDYESAAQVRADILAEAHWARDLVRMRRDRDTSYVSGWSGPGPWKLGTRATPYQVHPMRTICGPRIAGTAFPCQSGCLCLTPVDPCDTPRFGFEPLGLWSLLSRAYDDVDYEDYFWIRENERRNRDGTTGLLYTQYNACSDVYPMTSTEQTDGGMAGALVELYERTNDPTCLQVAVSYAEAMANNGIYNVSGDPRNGMIVSGGFVVSTGTTAETGDPDYFNNLNHFGGTGSLLAAYVACKKYNLAHPAAPIATSTQLSSWIAKAKNSAQVAEQVILYPGLAWATEWYNTLGYFNDYYGYLSGSAAAAAKQLEKLSSLNTDEQATLDALRGFIETGANYFLPRWEQQVMRSEKASGDNARSWPQFMYMRPYVSSTTAAAYEDQVLRAGLNWLRIQYADANLEGLWMTANPLAHQVIDTDQLFMTKNIAPAVYPWGISYSFGHSNLSSSQRDDLLAILNTVEKTTIDHFKQPLSSGYQGYAFGYLGSITTAPGTDESGGFERRFIDNYVLLLDNLPVTLPTPPTASIKPESLISPPAGGQTFSFTIHVPTATSQSDLQDALDNRTKIARWQTSGGTWQRTTLWPGTGFFGTPSYDVNAKTVMLTTTQTIGAGAGEFKFEVRTWDADGQWSRDTSYQQNW